MAEILSVLNEEPASYRFTVKEWHRLGEGGFFGEEERLELLDGEIIVMSPIGNRHAAATCNLLEFFVESSRRRYLVSAGNPIEADAKSEPLPDVMLLPRAQKTAKRHPFTHDAVLIVEVAESSLAHDRGRKLRKYAKSGVAEYWIVNLQEDVIEVYRSPEGQEYRERITIQGEESLAPLAFPDMVVVAGEIIPPR